MVVIRPSRKLETAFIVVAILALATAPALAQQGSVLTTLENQVVTAAKGWETTIMNAARSLFWILAGIEIGIAAVWLAINAASLDAWFAELVRRIMFIGLFAFILDRAPALAKAVVDSLFQIGAGGGSASPANIFDAGIRVASKMSEQAKFGLWEDNALAIAAVFAMIVVVVAFSLVAAIFVAVMVEMYVGLLAGMIMLGLGGSSYTKDFAVRYLVYAFSVGMKLMALVMIAKIGSDILIGLAEAPTATSDQFITTIGIAGISVVVFIIAMYVPPIIQGVVQGASVSGGMEAIRHGGQAASFAAGAAFLTAGAASKGFQAASAARAGGASLGSAAMRGMEAGIGGASSAVGSAAREKAIGSPGAYAGSLLGLANAKLDQTPQTGRPSTPPPPPPVNENK
ncbi:MULTISPECIES: P-type conjugative transfer protein TrbL [Rhizobium/Agrobacterium group]|uniref:P-type conjugative transfer protein TrbL n=1 Tax=Rhizobium/Agrobacterium group TaxID=227290 RepID=UPI001296BD3E|nr:MULTISPECIES: P-type conjugative transfer protein TrbL [Rhizobium/Agrobacterium group]MCF1495068.1 P-type conjugative transfer protein TrbL [Allorhizobium ampelinum]MCM2435950.1 P-type conjugative transfer protein TrbL [Agrobacterium rosae]MCW8059414.1 P-type conjugative transfer protein TrbL [Agrobacterium tumefaciens]MCW8145485.1 P-type conjugative transfer protein TrbL [Agrobacterium tumefaciens]MQB13307.1 P-type conjugative transfer protein TrbL [Agrobacterium sp. ICMP 6402]